MSTATYEHFKQTFTSFAPSIGSKTTNCCDNTNLNVSTTIRVAGKAKHDNYTITSITQNVANGIGLQRFV
jgi:hypothetical protein